MKCQHCGSIFGDIESLQAHQVAACPAIMSDEDSIIVPDKSENSAGSFSFFYLI